MAGKVHLICGPAGIIYPLRDSLPLQSTADGIGHVGGPLGEGVNDQVGGLGDGDNAVALQLTETVDQIKASAVKGGGAHLHTNGLAVERLAEVVDRQVGIDDG